MISQAESLVHVLSAAAISAALLSFGLRGTPPRKTGDAKSKRIRRWPSILGGSVGTIMSGVVAVADDVQPWEADSSALSMLVVAAIAVIAGAIFMRRGLRGRRVGDHPYCSACGFDLFGKPDGVNVCGECGKPLDTTSAVVIGERQRRMVPIYIGLFLIIAAMAFSVAPGRGVYRWAAAKDWWWLTTNSYLISNYNGVAAYNGRDNELYRRISKGSLNAAEMRAVLDKTLAARSTTGASTYSVALMSAMSIVTEGWRRGTLDEATVRGVMRREFDLQLVVGARTARGGAFRFSVETSDWQLTRQDAIAAPYRLTLTNRHDRLAGHDLDEKDRMRSSYAEGQMSYREIDKDNCIALKDLADLPLGPAIFEERSTATLTLTTPGRPALVETGDILLTGLTTIVDADAMRCPPLKDVDLDISKTIDDPENIARQAKAPLAEPDLSVGPHAAAVLDTDPDSIGHAIEIDDLQSGTILGDAYLRVNGKETLLGPILLRQYDSVKFKMKDRPPEPFEVVIRPTPERGAELFNQPATYQTEIVLKSQSLP